MRVPVGVVKSRPRAPTLCGLQSLTPAFIRGLRLGGDVAERLKAAVC